MKALAIAMLSVGFITLTLGFVYIGLCLIMEIKEMIKELKEENETNIK